MRSKLFFLVTMVLFFSMTTCAFAQDDSATRDNPTELPTTTTITDSTITDTMKTVLGEAILNILKNGKSVEAFHLSEWAIDTSDQNFHGFKVIASTDSLSTEFVNELGNTLTDETTYLWDGVAKRCDFGPNIGFRFKDGETTISVLIAYNCDVVQIFENGEIKWIEDCDPAHNKLVNLGNQVFPNAFTGYAAAE